MPDAEVLRIAGTEVRPGEPIMEIVPTEEKLVIEAQLDPINRGYVEV